MGSEHRPAQPVVPSLSVYFDIHIEWEDVRNPRCAKYCKRRPQSTLKREGRAVPSQRPAFSAPAGNRTAAECAAVTPDLPWRTWIHKVGWVKLDWLRDFPEACRHFPVSGGRQKQIPSCGRSAVFPGRPCLLISVHRGNRHESAVVSLFCPVACCRCHHSACAGKSPRRRE